MAVGPGHDLPHDPYRLKRRAPGMYPAAAAEVTGMRTTIRCCLLLLPCAWIAAAGDGPTGSWLDGLLALPRQLMDGGWVVGVQLAGSVIAACYAIERFRRLRRDRIAPAGFADEADRLWRAGRHDELIALCDRRPSTLARIVRFLVLHRANPIADLSRAVSDLGGREIRRHIQKAYPLAVIGMLEPLLGLLGTVVGMMETFAAVANAGALGDASVLAHGISKFLICTGTGLFIAVPCLVLYHHFKLKSAALAYALEEDVDRLMHGWFLAHDEPPASAARSLDGPAVALTGAIA